MSVKRIALTVLVLVACTFAETRGQPNTGLNAQRVTFVMKFTVTATAGIQKNTLTFAIPKDLPQRQKVVSLAYSLQPTEEFEADGVRYARFVMLNPPRSLVITTTATVDVYRFDFNTVKAQSKPSLESAAEVQPWLVSEKCLEKDAPEIQKAAAAMTGADEIAVLHNIMAFVTSTLRQSAYSPDDRGAVWALENKYGDCTEFADLFIALCRAKKIPTRYCEGYLTSPRPAGQPAAHDWAEAYTSKYGWIRFDPLHVYDRSATFDSIKPEYVQFSTLRHDSVLKDTHYYRWDWEGNGNVRVDNHFAVTRRDPVR
jgi:transglutaminase-like putative cysteine protease